ncbi:ABC-F family ATP-binding cassette domain-containing protein [Bacillus kwashiorkori]|uniref:ABC-F family ATP-binding cassette domain-containing protein n=1 Tax=Bacillus kwashiorkori TaxID=1522318 RepID=UPI000780D546|nr:ABC-F family ATP-binding cassette domain-containing protein [Bacillus kwashiorkori]
MILLQINQLNKYFGAELILSNIKLEIQTRDRIALVGRNGAGKSTLLKIIADKEAYESGEMIKPKEVTIGYLDQHTGLQSTMSIWDEMLTVFRHLQEMETKLRHLEQKMADRAILSDENQYEKIMSEYDQLLNSYKDLGGYQYEADIRSVLHGLNFQGFDYSTKISSLSGGQKTRLALAKLLLSKPDILILDEPTNHLDIETLSWLEQYLQAYEGAILIVSHDRYFLDKVVNQVYELAQMTLTKYPGNYSKYLVQKAENYEREMKLFEKQQEEIAKMKDFIQKNLARASTTKRAQSRRRTLEKMNILDRPQGDEKSASFSFDIERQSGNEVLNIKDLAIGYNDNVISKSIQLRITRGESVALLGPNGIGKSTLLKTIVKKLQLLRGSIQLGTNVSVAYYDQEQANLTSNKRVLNELWDEYPTIPEKEIRNTLGNFLFSGEDVLKTVSTLSGGEKARLALAKLMMQKANFLILDEPTNHLDLDSKEILENALIDYPGTILFVSHDRYFINRIATKVIEMTNEGVLEYLGDYDYFVEKKQEMIELEELKQMELNKKQNNASMQTKNSYEVEKETRRLERQRRRRMEEIEQQIELLEEEVGIKEKQMFDPSISSDHEQLAFLSEEVIHAKAEIDKLLEEWTMLEEQNEDGVLP